MCLVGCVLVLSKQNSLRETRGLKHGLRVSQSFQKEQVGSPDLVSSSVIGSFQEDQPFGPTLCLLLSQAHRPSPQSHHLDSQEDPGESISQKSSFGNQNGKTSSLINIYICIYIHKYCLVLVNYSISKAMSAYSNFQSIWIINKNMMIFTFG